MVMPRRMQTLGALAIGCAAGWMLCTASGCALAFLAVARADGPPADVITQSCTDTLHVYGVPGANMPAQWYDTPGARFELPGRTWQDLYASVAVIPLADPTQAPHWKRVVLPGASSSPAPLYITDGEVAVACSSTATIAVR